MGKLNCRCGNQISDVCSPCSEKGWLIDDVSLENEVIDESANVIIVAVDVWECRDCGSIAFGNHKDNTVRWYRPDEKPEQSLMARANRTNKSDTGGES
jgi:hypothetical protein